MAARHREAVFGADLCARRAAGDAGVTDVGGVKCRRTISITVRPGGATRAREVRDRDAGRERLLSHHIRREGEEDIRRHRGVFADRRSDVIERTAHPITRLTLHGAGHRALAIRHQRVDAASRVGITGVDSARVQVITVHCGSELHATQYPTLSQDTGVIVAGTIFETIVTVLTGRTETIAAYRRRAGAAIRWAAVAVLITVTDGVLAERIFTRRNALLLTIRPGEGVAAVDGAGQAGLAVRADAIAAPNIADRATITRAGGAALSGLAVIIAADHRTQTAITWAIGTLLSTGAGPVAANGVRVACIPDVEGPCI